ncbi:hypothetical protein LTS10_012686 [Elasticomyces elasticus]|nr:hypothetical protein LTS10_012686 [Elasticomyces elasticus]
MAGTRQEQNSEMAKNMFGVYNAMADHNTPMSSIKTVGMEQRQDAQVAVMNTLGSMFDNPLHSDLTIRCLGREWHVYKIMLCAQSPYFRGACEGRFREATENVITLRDDDPEVVAAMLGYLYTFEYADNQDPLFNVHVHIIADKYDLPHLAKLATTKFVAAAKTAWSSSSFAEAAALIFTDGTAISKELRQSMISIVTKHARSLKLDPTGAHFRDVMSSAPTLAMALWHAQDLGVGAEASNTQEIRHLCPSDCGESLSSPQLSKNMTQVCPRCHRIDFTQSWETSI